MCGSALAGNIYCLVSAPRSSLCPPVPVPVPDDTISHNRRKNRLFQELLSGPASSVGLPVQGWRFQSVALSPRGLCVVAGLRLSHGALLCPGNPWKGLGTELTGHRQNLIHPYAWGAMILLTYCTVQSGCQLTYISSQS